MRRREGEVSHVELELSQPIGLAALKKVFGRAQTSPRLHPGSTAKLIFYVEKKDRPRSCALIVELPKGQLKPRPTTTIDRLSIRRD
jgi:hypothetical protein